MNPEVVGVAIPLAITGIGYAAGYFRIRRNSTTRPQALRPMCFASGWLALAVALMPPLDALSDELFAFHMVQHEVLMLVAAPLLVLGSPLPVFLWAFPRRGRNRIALVSRHFAVRGPWRVLTGPLSGWLFHAVALWGWHTPPLFEAALEHPGIHGLQHVSFFLTALIFWNGLLRARGGSHNGAAVLYLFTTTVHSGVLGALITFAAYPWFPHYQATTAEWGLSALEDQQLGGLIMWVPASLVYVGAGLYLLGRWIQDSRLAEPSRS